MFQVKKGIQVSCEWCQLNLSTKPNSDRLSRCGSWWTRWTLVKTYYLEPHCRARNPGKGQWEAKVTARSTARLRRHWAAAKAFHVARTDRPRIWKRTTSETRMEMQLFSGIRGIQIWKAIQVIIALRCFSFCPLRFRTYKLTKKSR